MCTYPSSDPFQIEESGLTFHKPMASVSYIISSEKYVSPFNKYTNQSTQRALSVTEQKEKKVNNVHNSCENHKYKHTTRVN